MDLARTMAADVVPLVFGCLRVRPPQRIPAMAGEVPGAGGRSARRQPINWTALTSLSHAAPHPPDGTAALHIPLIPDKVDTVMLYADAFILDGELRDRNRQMRGRVSDVC